MLILLIYTLLELTYSEEKAMDWSYKHLFLIVLIGLATIHGTHGTSIVSGTVFCDQCKDGHVTLFDYPLYGIKVAMACPGNDGQLKVYAEETTNWAGNFKMVFDGVPDLGSCFAQVSGEGSSGCGAVAGPAKAVRLLFKIFGTAMYLVDPLVSQPAQPVSYCSTSSAPRPGTGVPVTPSLPPPTKILPQPKPVVKPPTPVVKPPTPVVRPMPPLPPMPPAPFTEPSACSHQSWTRPEYKCYWKVVTPDSKVAVVFGLIAARRYGTDMSLWQALQGRGDPYRTLLREGTTALLNSYNSMQFPYHPLAVIWHMNYALMGSTRQVLHTGLGFVRANSGNGKVPCKLTVCK